MSRILVNKASGDSVLQVLEKKARKNCQIVPFLPMCFQYMGKMGSICHFPRALPASNAGHCSQILVLSSIWGTQKGLWQWHFSCCVSQHLGILRPPSTAKQEKTQNDKSTLFYPPPGHGQKIHLWTSIPITSFSGHGTGACIGSATLLEGADQAIFTQCRLIEGPWRTTKHSILFKSKKTEFPELGIRQKGRVQKGLKETWHRTSPTSFQLHTWDME